MARTLPYLAYRGYINRPIYTDRLLDTEIGRLTTAMKRKYSGKTRAGKRRRVRGVVGKANAAYRIARSLKAGEEVKQFSFESTQAQGGANIVVEQSILAGLAQGTNRNQRIGIRIRVKRIKLTVAVQLDAQTDTSSFAAFARFIMWQFTGRAIGDTDSSLLSASYLDLDGSDRPVQPDTSTVTVFASKANDGRFTESKTLRDKVFSLNQHTLAFNSTAAEMEIGQNQALVCKNEIVYPPKKMLTFVNNAPDEAIVLTMVCSQNATWLVRGMVFYTDS